MPGLIFGGSYTLEVAKKYAKEDSKVANKTFYVNKQQYSNRYTINPHTSGNAVAAYRNGKEIKLSNPSTSKDLKIRLVSGSKEQLKSLLRKAGFAVSGSRQKNPINCSYKVTNLNGKHLGWVCANFLSEAKKLAKQSYGSNIKVFLKE